MFRSLHLSPRNARRPLAHPARSSESGLFLSATREDVHESDAAVDHSTISADHRSLTTGTVSSAHSGSSTISTTDPIGLHVVHDPGDHRRFDIIFVHGLGGTSRLSWSKDKDLNNFWPATFLPHESDISKGRISTFGYNANIVRDTSNKTSSISEFAHELLFQLKFAKGENAEELDIGSVPIIFVAHSMGGLVIKEAHLQGMNDPDYGGIVQKVTSILFLSTPHRGTNLAESLNRILQASFISTPKQFIADLSKNSFILQKLNDQFRHVAPKLDIVSFYETQLTPIGLQRTRIMVLERDSSVLGYPGEISKALQTDHHGVCKYSNTHDPCYISVRNVLQTFIRKHLTSASELDHQPAAEISEFDAENALHIDEQPDADYSFFRGRWSSGTCNWILENELFLNWQTSDDFHPRLLWINGPAASGKSVLASFIINHLVEKHLSCQYFFIRFGDQSKRSAGTLLRTLALQIADAVPAFRHKLSLVSDEIAKIKASDVQTLWQKLFRSTLFKTVLSKPIYWVIDGLEESDSPRTILKLISDVMQAPVTIRVLLLSRKSQDLTLAFHKFFNGPYFESLSNEGHEHDFVHFINQELHLRNNDRFKSQVTQDILASAKGNFLWVHLAIQKINKCVTKAEVRKAFEELPPGMEALYGRMADSVTNIPDESNRQRAHDILVWVACTSRILSIQELCQALETDDEEIIDLPRSIEALCGGFVVVDSSGHVAMIHQTAREYLLGDKQRTLNIDKRYANEQIFIRCMALLMENGLRAKINRGQQLEILNYATEEWFRHLYNANLVSETSMNVLMMFLKGTSVLVWIQALASRQHLRTLVSASTYLSRFGDRLKTNDLKVIPYDRQISERELVEKWSIDLVKIVGKFGANITQKPESIHKLVPPFCPHGSVLYQQYGKREARSLNVKGLSHHDWDDLLARLSFEHGFRAERIEAVGAHIAVLDASGQVLMFRENTFERHQQISHGERIRLMKFNEMGTLCATYGAFTTKVWNTSSGQCTVTVSNPATRARPQSMTFSDDDTKLLLGTNDGRLWSMLILAPSVRWKNMTQIVEHQLEGTIINSPTCMAISPDGHQIALGYRSYPATVWDILGPEHVSHCFRRDAENSGGEVNQICWHPSSGEVLGLYLEGIVFKWNPYEDDVNEVRTGGTKLTISQDGNFFATGDASGNVKIFSTIEFCIVYQLAGQDPVRDMSFSPDTRRLYDIRGSFGNVWEPTTLIKLAEMTERGSDNASDAQSIIAPSITLEAQCDSIDNITTLAIHPSGRCYSIGTEDGVASLYDIQQGQKNADLGQSGSFMTTEQMAWSPNGRYVALADLGGRLSVKTCRPQSNSSAPWIVESRFEMSISNTRGAILQLLFHPASTKVFVYTASVINVVTISSSEIESSYSLEPPNKTYKWITHPHDDKVLVAIGSGVFHLHRWDDLEVIQTICAASPFRDHRLQMSFVSGDDSEIGSSHARLRKMSAASAREPWRGRNAQEQIEQVLVTPSKSHILVQTSYPIDQSPRRHKQIILFEVEALTDEPTTKPVFSESLTSGDVSESILSIDSVSESGEIQYITLPENLSSEVVTPLAFLSSDRLVFLDQNCWICSWRIPLPSNMQRRRTSDTGLAANSMAEIRQHYFLPGDWISPDCLALCTVTGDGTVLCPRNGEVAVIKCTGLRN